jgi:hypothetical protein
MTKIASRRTAKATRIMPRALPKWTRTKPTAKTTRKRKRKRAPPALWKAPAAERARWSEVFASTEATGRVALACTLLADTDMNAATVVKALASTPVAEARRASLASRHAAEPVPTPAPGGAQPAEAGSDAEWARSTMAIADQFRGKKPAAAPAP